MAAGAPDSPETPASAAAAQGVTSEFPAGTTQPAAPVNGFAAEPEPPLADNPEVVVGAALIGGFLLGKLVKRLGS